MGHPQVLGMGVRQEKPERKQCANWCFDPAEMGSSVLDPYERKGIPKTQVKNRTWGTRPRDGETAREADSSLRSE